MRGTALVALAVAASLLSTGRSNATMVSDHEAALRGLIAAAAHGQLDEQRLTPALADMVRPQKAIAQAELTALGPVQSVTLERVASDGSEIYLTTFEHGALEWAFALSADGRISNAMYRKPKAPAP